MPLDSEIVEQALQNSPASQEWQLENVLFPLDVLVGENECSVRNQSPQPVCHMGVGSVLVFSCARILNRSGKSYSHRKESIASADKLCRHKNV